MDFNELGVDVLVGGRSGVVSPLARLLSAYVELSPGECAAIGRVGTRSVRQIAPRRNLTREGARSGTIILIVEGWACSVKSLADGRRQTLGFVLPGDLCDPKTHILTRTDYGIGSITRLKFAEIDRAELDALTARFPRVADALYRSELVEASIRREWILNMGQRTAHEHLAHLIAELFHRMQLVGLARGDRFDFPLTQCDLADATGLSSVHVNRVMKDLRRDGLIELNHRELRIPDLGRLERAGLFQSGYLHLDERDEVAAINFARWLQSQGNRLGPQQSEDADDNISWLNSCYPTYLHVIWTEQHEFQGTRVSPGDQGCRRC